MKTIVRATMSVKTVTDETDLNYGDIIRLAKLFGRQVVLDEDNKMRFRSNAILALKEKGLFSISHAHELYEQGNVTLEDMMKLYMDIGYSLCGFSNFFDQPIKKCCNDFDVPPKDDESCIDYMLRIFGKKK